MPTGTPTNEANTETETQSLTAEITNPSLFLWENSQPFELGTLHSPSILFIEQGWATMQVLIKLCN